MSRYAKLAATPVPQSEPLTPNQVKNNAGGFVFALDDFKRLDRFLVLGSDTNTYYQKAQQLTRENAACVQRCYDVDASRTVLRIVEISHEGRAPKNDPAIFALALGAAHADVKIRKLALDALPSVCRTSMHLFQFLDICKALGRGWGRALKNAVARWYDVRSTDAIAYQAVKYRSRENFTHKRTLQTARWRNKVGADRQALYKWMKGEECDVSALPALVRGHLSAMALAGKPQEVAKLVTEYQLPWEAVPTDVAKTPEVLAALLPHMGLTALMRNLGALTAAEVLKPLSAELDHVLAQFADVEQLRKARLHPFNLMVAQAAYSGGAGRSRRVSWKPVPKVVAALEKAFYASFKTITPSGKRTLLGIDVSASMTWSPLLGTNITPRQASAVMAMTILRTEPRSHAHAFATNFSELPLHENMSLQQVIDLIERQPAMGTDCALPMLYALEKGLQVDVFQIYTDSETWAGRMHPVGALQRYRKATGIPAKLIVVGMTSTGFTIADPSDPGMLDVVGFDSAAPSVMTEFARG